MTWVQVLLLLRSSTHTHTSHTPRDPGVVALGAGCPGPREDSNNEDQEN